MDKTKRHHHRISDLTSGQRLRVAVDLAERSIRALCEAAGVSRPMLYRYMDPDDHVEMPLPMVRRLAAVLCVSPAWLAFGAGSMWSPNPEGSAEYTAADFLHWLQSAPSGAMMPVSEMKRVLDDLGFSEAREPG